MKHAYLFEAKSIQSYLLDTGRLRDLIGGSELLASLWTDLLEDVLETLPDADRVRFSRRSGGGVYAFADDREIIRRFGNLWSLAVRQAAPLLDFAQSYGEGRTDKQAFQTAQTRLLENIDRRQPTLPETSPLADRNPRNAQPAVSISRGQAGQSERQDIVTQIRERFVARTTLAQKFIKDAPKSRWPRDLAQEFPFEREKRYLALVHADGNGLGRILMRLTSRLDALRKEDYVAVFSDFSESIRNVTIAAARRALLAALPPEERVAETSSFLPARPIVLGGDDLTILLRADLAIPFVNEFLQAFEHESASAMKRLRERTADIDWPDYLTASAGIAFIRASQPFSMAYQLAEELCAHAKSHSREAVPDDAVLPATVSIYRIKSALADDYETLLQREVDVIHDGLRLRNSLEVYAVSATAPPTIPRLDQLTELTRLLSSPELAGGKGRDLLTAVSADPMTAQQRYRRWREIMQADGYLAHLEDFDRLIDEMTGSADALSGLALPFRAQTENFAVSPLGDAVTVMAVGGQHVG